MFTVECNFSCSYDIYWHVLWSKRFVGDNLRCEVDLRYPDLGRYKPDIYFSICCFNNIKRPECKKKLHTGNNIS